MKKNKILLIEDDPNLGYILQESLELQEFEITRKEDGEAGYSTFLKEKFDICLIDVMLPKKDGFTLAKEIRAIDQDIPLIFLTAKSLKEDRIEGLKIGADDYITKPFSMEELILRIQAVLKRVNKVKELNENENKKKFEIGTYIFDYEKSILSIGGKQQKLTHKEAELLRLLCLHKNQELSREAALKQIWEEDSFFTARSMDVYISKLRKYLEDDESIKINNIHGKGFKLFVRT
ncbi:response regulator transcription factor [candidate division KSB1 bacterium]|nr:response regulator transcription factor [candidate division KSB1 bacterium]